MKDEYKKKVNLFQLFYLFTSFAKLFTSQITHQPSTTLLFFFMHSNYHPKSIHLKIHIDRMKKLFCEKSIRLLWIF